MTQSPRLVKVVQKSVKIARGQGSKLSEESKARGKLRLESDQKLGSASLSRRSLGISKFARLRAQLSSVCALATERKSSTCEPRCRIMHGPLRAYMYLTHLLFHSEKDRQMLRDCKTSWFSARYRPCQFTGPALPLQMPQEQGSSVSCETLSLGSDKCHRSQLCTLSMRAQRSLMHWENT